MDIRRWSKKMLSLGKPTFKKLFIKDNKLCILMQNSACKSANLCGILHYNSHAEVSMCRTLYYKVMQRYMWRLRIIYLCELENWFCTHLQTSKLFITPQYLVGTVPVPLLKYLLYPFCDCCCCCCCFEVMRIEEVGSVEREEEVVETVDDEMAKSRL